MTDQTENGSPLAPSGQSPAVVSDQQGPHEQLAVRVRRYRDSHYQRPVAAHSQQAFDDIANWLRDCGAAADGGHVILDSGCGRGDSTVRLAARHRDRLVVGIDKSAYRLDKLARARGGCLPENMLLVRADLRDLYRLMASAGWRLAAHYVLYPNPWPKAAHLSRRWHGSPSFGDMLALGGYLEMRTNWRVYAEEWADALALFGHPAGVCAVAADSPISLHEAKYRASGHALWSVAVDLADSRAGERV